MFLIWACILCEYRQTTFDKFSITEWFPFFSHRFTQLKAQSSNQFRIFLVATKHNLLLFNRFFQVLNFVSLCLINNFIKLGRVFCGVVTFDVVFFYDRNCTLALKADNTQCCCRIMALVSLVFNFEYINSIEYRIQFFVSDRCHSLILRCW